METVLASTEIAASGSATSNTVWLDQIKSEGNFSVEIVATGSGTCKIEYKLSYDRTNFVDSGTDIATGVTAGRMIYALPANEPAVAPYIQFIITETGGADSITAVLKMCTQ